MNKRMLGLLLVLCLFIPAMVVDASAMEQAIANAATSFTAEDDLPATCSESTLGDLVADAVRSVCKTDIAIIPGGMLSGTLDGGSIFESDLERIIPVDMDIDIIYVTASQLSDILEYGISFLQTNDAEQIDVELSAWEGYPQVSGFTWTYDVSAPAGSRIMYLYINNTEIDLSDDTIYYSLAAPSALFDGSLGYPELYSESSSYTLRSALLEYCTQQTVLYSVSSRTTAVGTSSYPLIGQLPVIVIVIACFLISFIATIPRWKEKKYFSFSR